MGTVLVAISGVFIVLGLWMGVELLANKHLGTRPPGCGCGALRKGQDADRSGVDSTCRHCTQPLPQPPTTPVTLTGDERE